MNGLIVCLGTPENVIMIDGNAGKGDKYRKVDQKKWDEGWESAFGTKKNKLKRIMQSNGVLYDMTNIPQKEKENKNE